MPDPEQTYDALREANYNAAVMQVIRIHEDLMRIRIRPDDGVPPFLAGQYTVLGLGSWEPRAPETQPEPPGLFATPKVIKRAYSISCALLDEFGKLVRSTSGQELEFFIALIRNTTGRPPLLTPRLFCLKLGDRLNWGPQIRGRYTLEGLDADAKVLFLATGTGEAPHNAMLAELLAGGHRGEIACVTCVRRQRDLAYREAHRILENRYSNYRYLTLTTREPVNIDPTEVGYVGKRYLQEYLISGDLEEDLAWEISPSDTHVFLCGNPQMIGAPVSGTAADTSQVSSPGLVPLLQQRGFTVAEKGAVGNLHYERYW